MGPQNSRTLEEIQEYWKKAAESPTDNLGLRPTARDPYLQLAVEDAIEPWLNLQATLLDVGCGDGLSTLRFARAVKSAVGLDYIDQFVLQARHHAKENNIPNVIFEKESVLDLRNVRQRHALFDIAITIRCLINLPSWPDQIAALREICSCLRPGGLYLTSEGWAEGMAGLNLRRQRAGLASISVVDYNLLISRNQFEKEIEKDFDIVAYRSLGVYLFMSRVVQPAFVYPSAPSHDHSLNRVARELNRTQGLGGEFMDCDYAGIYVLRKRN